MQGIEIQANAAPVIIEVVPLKESLSLVLFEPFREAPEKPKKTRGKSAEVVALRQELAATREYLQSVIEQQETSNEELRSANEEIQSSNEELQSINEELETTKEELQSVNEELATVNDELESRNRELTVTNSDLVNLINSVGIPLVIVGMDLKIKRFSPVKGPLNLEPHDIGRSILECSMPLRGMEQVLLDAIKSIGYKEIEIRDEGGHWYSMRIKPYLTFENRIEGAVVAFIDINEIKMGFDAAKDARDYAESVIAALKYPVLILDRGLRVVSASSAYLETFEVTQKETVDNLLYRLGNGQWAIPGLRSLLDNVLSTGESFDDYVMEHDFERIGKKAVSVCGRKIPQGRKMPPLILMQIEVN